nr:LytTR family DNA-binding domain-containing protein [uncultured Flavobacterium sp.]
MVIKTILVDDEILNLKNLEIILNNNFPNIEILGLFQNVADAKIFLEENSIDLLFLDISMPIADGFDLLKHFPKKCFNTVFITAYQDYAIQALRAGAIDYILKPIILEELRTAINKVTEATLINKKEDSKNIIMLNYEGGKSIIELDQIIYLKGFDNLTTLYLFNNKKITISKTLKHFEEILGNGFFRNHKSYVVNLKFIKKIATKESYLLELNDGTQLPISRRNYKNLKDYLKITSL